MTTRRKGEIAVETALFLFSVVILLAGAGYEPWSGFVGMAGGTALGRLICHAPAIIEALGSSRA